MDKTELQSKKLPELKTLAKAIGIEGFEKLKPSLTNKRCESVLSKTLRSQAEMSHAVYNLIFSNHFKSRRHFKRTRYFLCYFSKKFKN